MLFQILRKRPDLIRYVFEAPWAEYRASIQLSDENAVGSDSKAHEWKWSIAVLQQAFTRLTSLATSRFKLCFFIDGVDECEGDQEGLSEYFLDISKLPNLKICLSSRPWLIFEDTFAGCHGLRLQDLTRHDMRLYVHDKLAANRRMVELSKLYPEATRKFIKTAETKANGVFLWVKLVTKSLLDGLRNQDGIDDLQKRLESLPSDLNVLYCLMLGRVEDLYMEQASRIFQIYDSASDLNLRMSALELELAVSADVNDGINCGRESMTAEEIGNRSQKMTAHLKSRCEGLLEVHDLLDRQWDAFDNDIDLGLSSNNGVKNDEDSLVNDTERLRTKVDLKVSYLHRTVKDFLKTQYARERFSHRTTADFDPNLAILVSYVLNLKLSICSFYYDVQGLSWDERLWNTMGDALLFASNIGAQSQPSRDMLLHYLYNLGQHWWQHKSLSIDIQLLNPNPYRHAAEWRQKFMSLAVHFGLTSFVDEQLRWPQQQSLSLLPLALRIKQPEIIATLSQARSRPVSLEMARIILRHGADPNELTSDPCTTWEMTLTSVHRGKGSQDNPNILRHQALLFKMMLENGADVFAKCASHTAPGGSALDEISRGEHTVAAVVFDMFAEHLSEETEMLYELLLEKRAAANSKDDQRLAKRRRDLLEHQHTRGLPAIHIVLDEERLNATNLNTISHRVLKRQRLTSSDRQY